jgi:hypothetical protein
VALGAVLALGGAAVLAAVVLALRNGTPTAPVALRGGEEAQQAQPKPAGPEGVPATESKGGDIPRPATEAGRPTEREAPRPAAGRGASAPPAGPAPPKPEPKPQPPPKPEPKSDAPGGEVKELAVLKGPPGPVGWLDLSADGSRLAAAGPGIVWDVAEQRQVCVCKATGPGNGPPGFGLMHLSADGQTVFTAKGQTLRVWDGTTGNELLAVPPLKYGSDYTAAALSPDGAYLALSGYEWTGRSNGTLRFYTVGAITVWDVKAQKEKWKVPGVADKDEARTFSPPSFQTSVNRLAFSPDGSRLAAVGHALRIFALEAGKDVPTVVVEGQGGGDGTFEWLSGGKALVFQNGRDLWPIDPKTGTRKLGFTLTYPRPPPPKPVGNLLPLPQGPETAVPEGWDEHQIVLSANGSRLAAHVIREHEKEKFRNNAVILWDVAARRRVGAYKLPDDTYHPGTVVIRQLLAPPILLGTGHESDIRIALSGDGKRLAVADETGSVRVYSTAQIEAHTK